MKVTTPNKGKGGVIEKYFLRKYPRNVGWIKENFSGISEIYKPSTDAQETKIRNEWYAIQDRVYINGELVNSMFGEEGDPLEADESQGDGAGWCRGDQWARGGGGVLASLSFADPVWNRHCQKLTVFSPSANSSATFRGP